MRMNHFDQKGNAVMVDVSRKESTVRIAKAVGNIVVGKQVINQIQSKTAKKGDVLAVAQVAGIMAVKKTSDMIPMCHPLMISKCTVEFEVIEETQTIQATCMVKVEGKTGVEMEALHGVSVALLTIYDMCKGIDKSMRIDAVHLVLKEGGSSGVYEYKEDVR